jgi:hypothetical protein
MRLPSSSKVGYVVGTMTAEPSPVALNENGLVNGCGKRLGFPACLDFQLGQAGRYRVASCITAGDSTYVRTRRLSYKRLPTRSTRVLYRRAKANDVKTLLGAETWTELVGGSVHDRFVQYLFRACRGRSPFYPWQKEGIERLARGRNH